MIRYDLRRLTDGWAIIDAATGETISLYGKPQTGFSVCGAQDFVRILNRRAAERRSG